MSVVILFLLILILPFFVSQVESGTSTNTLYAHAEGATIWTDKGDYSPEETVTIFGSGFLANKQVAITITAPDSSVATIYATTDEFGAFTAYYTLDGMGGTYTVVATDGTNTATTTFTDTTYRYFTATISPNIAVTGETKSYTITITNDASSSHGVVLGSAKIAVPSGFTIISSLSVSYPSGKPWTATLVSGYIKLNATADSYRLSRGQSVSVTFSATAPGTAGTYTWTTTAWTDRSCGYAFTLKGTQPQVTVSTAPTVSITITSSPVTGSGFVKVDSTAYDTPHTFTWTVGGTHTLQALSPVSGGTGTQYVYTSWSDGGTQTHTYSVPSTSQTVTANYQTQYKLSMSTNFGTTNPSVGDYWYNAGLVVSIQAFAPSVVDGEQYVWLGWTGTGTISYTGTANPSSVTMNTPITETAAWRHEYRLTMVTNFGTTSPSVGNHWYEAGSIVSITATAPSTIDGERYVWNGWTGTGTISYTGMDSSASVTMNSPITQTASWNHQYRLTMAANFGTTDPSVGVHWYDAGSVVSIGVTAPSVVDGEQYVWLGWTGAGTISYTGTNNPDSVTMNSPITEIAAWRHEYRLTMVTNYGTTSPSAGVHWYEVGTPVSIQAFAPSVLTGEQYLWNGWTGTGTISYTGTANPSSVTMNSPISETASWTHQFLLTIKTNGLPSAYPTKVYLAGSQVGTASDTSPYTKWFDAETPTGTIGVDNTISGAANTRYVFVKWVEDSSTNNPRASENMNSPKIFTAEYKTQYQITVTASPTEAIGGQFKVAYTQCGTIYTTYEITSWTEWVDSGTTVTVSEPQTIISGSVGTRYKFESYSPSDAVTMDQAKTITLLYKTQYLLTVVTDPSGLTPQPTRNPAGEAGPANGWWYDASTSVTLTAQPVTGYPFNRWDVDGSLKTIGENPISVSMNTRHTATAHYTQIITYTLAITATTGGTTNPASGNTYTYSEGTTVNVAATPNAGYRFDHWVLNGSNAGSTSPISVLMDRNRSLQAVFAETHTLTISVSEGGTTNPVPGTYTYQTPTDVTVTTIPNVGYRLDHWIYDNNNIGSESSVTVHVGSSHTLKAVFAATPPLPQLPVGGHSISLIKQTPVSHMTAYTMLIALFGVVLILIKRKRK
jgi:hypothetical protein